jgi:predicted nucleotidyltransferase
MTKNEILNFLEQNYSYMSENFGVNKIALFGSFARDEATEDSDIDILVELESKNTFRSFFALLHFLEESLNHKVDLGIENTIKSTIKDNILKDAIYV